MPVANGESNLYFQKDTRVYLAQGTNIWALPVLAGYTFSQTTNTSEVTLNEMVDSTGTSRRGRAVFTDSFAPTEWGFDTYVRPFVKTEVDPDDNTVHAVEEPLWANFVAPNDYDAGDWDYGVTPALTKMDIDFDDSNKINLGVFDLYIVLGAAKVGTASNISYLDNGDTTIYKIPGASINEATINFDIDGIATISWSGMGGSITEQASFNATTAITGGIDATDNFIRNKLTQLAAVSSVSGATKTYAITLTGGSITISNNLSYLTPEVMGRVNHPLGHITGTRTVSGNFTCYMDEKTNGSIELFDDLQKATTAITNSFALDFYVGGKQTGFDLPTGPGIQFKIPSAHVSLPAIDTADVISVDVTFDGLPSNISDTDEISKITYVAG